MAYAERRERKKGVRHRGIHKAAGGRYRSAGTFGTKERALAVAEEAERHAAEVAGGVAGGLDPATRATRTIKEYAHVFLRHHQVEGNTKDYLGTQVRLASSQVTARHPNHEEAAALALPSDAAVLVREDIHQDRRGNRVDFTRTVWPADTTRLIVGD